MKRRILGIVGAALVLASMATTSVLAARVSTNAAGSVFSKNATK